MLLALCAGSLPFVSAVNPVPDTSINQFLDSAQMHAIQKIVLPKVVLADRLSMKVCK